MTSRQHATPSPSGRAPLGDERLRRLYAETLPASRSGALFGAFPYPTKISPETIALFIATHTQPGDTVFDGFAGSGTTGLAALLCGKPPASLKEKAKQLNLKVRWGERKAVLYELGALGAFIAQVLSNPPKPGVFLKAADELLEAAAEDDGWMYEAMDTEAQQGAARHLVWSDVLICAACQESASMWEGCVSRNPAIISSRFTCPSCGCQTAHGEATKLTERVEDDLLGTPRQIRLRKPAWIYGKTGARNWARPVNSGDLDLLREIDRMPLPGSVPFVEIPWGDLYRRGYHQGVTHLHHFYTRRNLLVFGRLWERIGAFSGDVADALRFWLLSYNASHATIMSRVVAKSGQKDLIVTSAQPGVLYISGLPVEKNLIAGLRRKLTTVANAFRQLHGCKGHVAVHQRSSCQVELPDRSVDYIFTDPPFGANIPYAELNFINESWLNRYTDRTYEAIISPSQGKTLADYQNLLRMAFSEARRVLKPSGLATVVFNSASANLWSALQSAYTEAGLGVQCASVLDKKQGSFKQVTTNGAVRGDPILLLGKQGNGRARQSNCPWTLAEHLWREAALAPDPMELTAQRLYSRLVAHYLAHHQAVPLNAESFYEWHTARSRSEGVANARI